MLNKEQLLAIDDGVELLYKDAVKKEFTKLPEEQKAAIVNSAMDEAERQGLIERTGEVRVVNGVAWPVYRKVILTE
jgi:hypothetical protein